MLTVLHLFASNQMLSFALSIMTAAFGGALVIGFALFLKKKKIFLAFPLVLLPIALFLSEKSSDHRLFLESLKTIAKPGELTIYRFEPNGSVQNHVQMTDALALIQGPSEKQVYHLRFTLTPALDCTSGRSNFLQLARVYKVLFNPKNANQFCLNESPSLSVKVDECLKLQTTLAEKEGAQRLNPDSVALKEQIIKLKTDSASTCAKSSFEFGL
jgi:hypothetical protein